MERPCESTVGTAETEEKNENGVMRTSFLCNEDTEDSMESVVEESHDVNGAIATSTSPHNVKFKNQRNIHGLKLEGWEMVWWHLCC